MSCRTYKRACQDCFQSIVLRNGMQAPWADTPLCLIPGKSQPAPLLWQGWGSWSPGGSSPWPVHAPRILPALEMWHCRAGFTASPLSAQGQPQGHRGQGVSKELLYSAGHHRAQCLDHLAATKVLKLCRKPGTSFLIFFFFKWSPLGYFLNFQ